MKPRYIALPLGVLFLAVAFFFFHQGRPADPFAKYESELESSITPKQIENHILAVASKPHRAGTENNRTVGDYLIRQLKQIGLDVTESEYEVLLQEPVEARIHILGPDSVSYDLREEILKEDPYSQSASSELAYFAFSPDSDLEAEVVYANYGAKEDYAVLAQNGISVAGKLILARAQGICRGMKVQIAEEQGAAGMLLYPEMRDQGFLKPPFPQGPHIPPSGLQRGSLLKYFHNPGEPSADQNTAPLIPAIPVSQEIASRIFEEMGGPLPPDDWKGWQKAGYRLGPGPARVRIRFRGDTQPRTIRNIVAVMKATNRLEIPILISNHYDAWVHGAADPGSGTATVLAAAEALTRLVQKGWQPQRDIVFAFWDAEEFGMFGSTKWFEENRKSKFAACINVDTAIKGRSFVGYVAPGLRATLDYALARVTDPDTGKTLDQLRGEYRVPGYSADTGPILGIGGIPAAEISFGYAYGVYHTLYDDPAWFSRYGDPGYRYSVAFAKVLANYIVQLSEPEIFPYRFAELVPYVREVITQKGFPEQAIRPLLEEMSRYEKAAQQWDQEFLSGKMKRDADSNAYQALKVLWRPSGSTFRDANHVLGPSDETGCGGEALPILQRAVRRKDDAVVMEEVQQLVRVFVESRKYLEASLRK